MMYSNLTKGSIMKRFLSLCLLVMFSFTIFAAQTRCDPNEEPPRYRLAWDPNSESDLAGYKVYSSQNSNMDPWLLEGTVLEPLTVYIIQKEAHLYYSVTAYDNSENSNESGFSNVVYFDKDVTSPADPGTVVIEEVAAAAVMMLPDGAEMMIADYIPGERSVIKDGITTGRAHHGIFNRALIHPLSSL